MKTYLKYTKNPEEFSNEKNSFRIFCIKQGCRSIIQFDGFAILINISEYIKYRCNIIENSENKRYDKASGGF